MVFALLLFLVPLAPGAERDALPGTQAEGTVCVLVRDARTGKPLAGVRVAQYLEDAGERFVTPVLLAETRTDKRGIAVVRWKDKPRDCHWIFDAPRFAVSEKYGWSPPDVVELEPGHDVSARVFGPFGKPRAGVRVEYLLGCSHSPAVRTAVTDAAGRFSIGGVNPRIGRFWLRAPGIASRFFDVGVGDLHAAPGLALTGRVTDDDGKPVANVVVGSHQEMRGPRARTGPDGAFRLEGYVPNETLFACGPRNRVAYPAPRPIDSRQPFRLIIRSPDQGETDGRPDPDAKRTAVRIVTLDAATGRPAPDVPAWLQRADGWLFFADDGVVHVPAGRYELHVGGGFGSHAAKQRTIEVKDGDVSEHRVVAQRQPRVALGGRGGLPKHADIELVTPHGMLRLRDDETGIGANVQAVVRVRGQGLTRVFPLGPVRDGKRTAELTWPAPRRLVLGLRSFRGSGGKRSVEIAGAWSERDGNIVRTHATGVQTLVVSDRNLGTQAIAVQVGEVPAQVPADALRTPGTLRVLSPNGEAFVTGQATVRDGFFKHSPRLSDGRSWCLRADAYVRVEREGYFPLRQKLADAGPYTLSWPGTELDIAADQTPPPANGFVVLIDGELFESKDGHVKLQGVPAGRHTILIGASGRRTKAYEVTLDPKAPALLKFTLQER